MCYKKENTIAVMTGKLSLNAVDKIINILNDIEENEEELDKNSEIELDNEISFDNISEDSYEILEKDVKDITIDKELNKFNDKVNLIEEINENQIDNSDN